MSLVPIQLKKKTYNGVLGLVALVLEVQVVLERVVLSALSNGCAVNGDVEFTPSLFRDPEGRLVEGCSKLSVLGEVLGGLLSRWRNVLCFGFANVGCSSYMTFSKTLACTCCP